MNNQIITISYFKLTKKIYYSLLFIFPMLFLYEVMCWIQFSGSSTEIRNGADVFLRQIIMGFGVYSDFVYGLILILIFLVIMYINRSVASGDRLTFTYLFFMLVESVIWSLGFIILMGISERLILSIIERNLVPEQFYLAIGAGIWEELLFRAGIIGLTLSFFTNIFGYGAIFSKIFSIIFAAVLFSLFHYLGPFGDIFTFKSFYLRALAGIFLGCLYLFRGLGITVYTHIFYDMVIISLPILLV